LHCLQAKCWEAHAVICCSQLLVSCAWCAVKVWSLSTVASEICCLGPRRPAQGRMHVCLAVTRQHCCPLVTSFSLVRLPIGRRCNALCSEGCDTAAGRAHSSKDGASAYAAAETCTWPCAMASVQARSTVGNVQTPRAHVAGQRSACLAGCRNRLAGYQVPKPALQIMVACQLARPNC
jgi:hypothetical protein